MTNNQQSDSVIDLEERKSYLGASEVAVVLGYGGYGTPLEIWEQKTGKSKDKEISDELRYRFARGNDMERIVAAEFERRTGFKTRRTHHTTTKFHKDHPQLGCHPDFALQGMQQLLEIKTTSSFHELREWKRESPTNYQAAFPMRHFIQLVVQLNILKYSYGWIAADLMGNFRYYGPIPSNPAWTKVHIIEPAALWWDKYVKTDTPPPALNMKEQGHRAFPEGGATAICDTEDIINWLATEKEAATTEAKAKKEKEAARLAITNQFADKAEILLSHSGEVLCTYKTQAGRQHFDSRAFDLAHPGLREPFISEGTPFKRFINKT